METEVSEDVALEDAPTPEQRAVEELQEAFTMLGIKATVESCEIKGPLRRYAVSPVKIRFARLQTYAEDIALAMGPIAPPLIRPAYESRLITIEMMFNEHPVVYFNSLAKGTDFTSEQVNEKCNLPILLGTTDVDRPLIVDLASMPHVAVAGCTGSGKSMLLHSIINSLIMNAKQAQVELALIDPKYVEFDIYKNSSILRYAEVYTSLKDSIAVLDDLHEQMDRRLQVFRKHRCRDISEYRSKIKEIPYIVLVVDEIADLIKDRKKDSKEFADKLCALAAKGRAAGIHLVIATQHPSAKVLTSEIRANFPCRIAFKVSSQVHSRVVLDFSGAEKLLGRGDGLLLDNTGNMVRFKGAFISPNSAKYNTGTYTKKGLIKSISSVLNKQKRRSVN